MVVGTNTYKDTKEAYPLDNKLLNKIALRSFLMDAGHSSETGSSLGFAWAIAPGLQKIHENKEDLTISLGHNLEFNECGGLFSSLVMGIVLSMEAIKADPASIRSIRTSLGLACHSLDMQVHIWLVLPLMVACAYSLLTQGILWPALVGAVIYFLIAVFLRFTLIKVGYAKGSRIAEKVIANQSRFKKACSAMGVFVLGFLILYSSRYFITLSSHTFTIGNSSYSLQTGLGYALPGILGICGTWSSYHLLTKKNWSLTKVGVLLAVVGFLLGVLL